MSTLSGYPVRLLEAVILSLKSACIFPGGFGQGFKAHTHRRSGNGDMAR